MNIGYVKLDKLNKLEYFYRNLFKIIKQKNNCYYIPSSNEKILVKLQEILKKDNINYIVQETGINCNFKQFNGKSIMKYMLPEILEYCYKMLNKDNRLEELHICVNEFTKDNISIIEELCERVKIINIVTNNINYRQLEKRLERNEKYIVVSNNRRKTLKRANLIINIDFLNFKEYVVNSNSIIINLPENVVLGKEFDGICIEKINVATNKVMRIFSEMENMNRSELIEAEIIKFNDYCEIRKMIKLNKLKIMNVYGRRNIIQANEFGILKRKNICTKENKSNKMCS